LPITVGVSRSRVRTKLIGVGIVGVIYFFGCGSNSGRGEFDDQQATNPNGASSGGDNVPQGGLGDQAKPPCEGLACQQVECDNGVTTTVSGIVTAPNGTLPLYNAIVFVPNAPLDPLADGASCDRCGSVSGKPLVATLTGVDGKFLLKNVPVGKDIPLVVQVGKWRRELKLPGVNKCTDNPITDANLTRLPKNKAEGHIPRIAVTTGRCDQLACLLPKLGLDPSEYSLPSGTGRLHLYRGAADSSATSPTTNVPAPAPTGTPDAPTLWSDPKKLANYDMVMLSCECAEHVETKPDAARAALYDFTQAGGRVFASHYHYVWAQTGALSGTAQWLGGSSSNASSAPPYQVDQTFPKGKAFAEWLVGVGAATTLGEIPISQPREDVGAVVTPTQRWVYGKRWAVPGIIPDPIIPESAKYLNVNTPVGKPADQQCGKFVFADMHLYGGDIQSPTTALPDDKFPTSCSTTMTPEEKALAFLFFDLSACIQDDTKPPSAPIK
jgi:hypothetical protein